MDWRIFSEYLCEHTLWFQHRTSILRISQTYYGLWALLRSKIFPLSRSGNKYIEYCVSVQTCLFRNKKRLHHNYDSMSYNPRYTKTFRNNLLRKPLSLYSLICTANFCPFRRQIGRFCRYTPFCKCVPVYIIKAAHILWNSQIMIRIWFRLHMSPLRQP